AGEQWGPRHDLQRRRGRLDSHALAGQGLRTGTVQTMTMRFDTRLFTLAKDPEQPGAYQDACCIDTEHHIAAIADGVSSALFSGPWAAILAEAVVAESPNPC